MRVTRSPWRCPLTLPAAPDSFARWLIDSEVELVLGRGGGNADWGPHASVPGNPTRATLADSLARRSGGSGACISIEESGERCDHPHRWRRIGAERLDSIERLPGYRLLGVGLRFDRIDLRPSG